MKLLVCGLGVFLIMGRFGHIVRKKQMVSLMQTGIEFVVRVMQWTYQSADGCEMNVGAGALGTLK